VEATGTVSAEAAICRIYACGLYKPFKALTMQMRLERT